MYFDSIRLIIMFKCALIVIAYFLYGVFCHIKIIEVTPCAKFKSEIPDVSLATNFAKGSFAANITIPFPFNDNVKVKSIVYVKEENKWKKSAVEFNMDFCSLMGNFESVWNRTIKQMKLSKSCPVPKGTYSISGLTATYEELNMELSFNNDYLFNIMFSKDGKNFMCREVQAKMSKDSPKKQ